MEQHDANRAFWDASTKWWKEKEDKRGLWKNAYDNPGCVLSPQEMPFLRGLKGKKVCVLGSGDNEAAFALAGLGATITSIDISQARLDIAAERARMLGVNQSFLRADVTDLSPLANESFDLVYTGGHMSVWVCDIQKYYQEAVRILISGGLFVVNEYHPIRRIWLDAEGSEPRHRYFDRGPYKYAPDDGLPTFEYHWTTADHIQAVVDAGCRIIKVEEYGDAIKDEWWMHAQLNGLPAYLMLIGRKDAQQENGGDA